MKDKITDQKEELQKAIDKASDRIQNAIDSHGPYSHNMIGAVLRDLSSSWGYEHANKLVRDFELDELYGIQEVEG